MKQNGKTDLEILNTLKEEGISPREISEALSQQKIKSAVSAENNPNTEGMEPSIYQNQENETNQYSQADNQNQFQTPSPNQTNQQYTQNYNQQNQYSQEQYAYQGQEQNYISQGLDIETVRDIAKQELEENMKKTKAQVDLLSKAKTDLGFQVQSIENRLIKIESIIQELQTAIIRKIGEYGEAVSSLSSELQETQKSFSKVINPLLDKKRNTGNVTNEEFQKAEETEEAEKPRASKQKDGFENYFR
jgi:predicted CopG family antitoxin